MIKNRKILEMNKTLKTNLKLNVIKSQSLTKHALKHILFLFNVVAKMPGLSVKVFIN